MTKTSKIVDIVCYALKIGVVILGHNTHLDWLMCMCVCVS